MDDARFYNRTQSQAGIPYPFCEVPPLDVPMTDARLADTLGAMLEAFAGLTRVLAVTRLGDVSEAQLQAAHSHLAAHAAAADTIFRRWVEDRQEDKTP
jgi:hypothetical protein